MFDHYDAHGLPIACDAAEAQVRSLRAYVREVIGERDKAQDEHRDYIDRIQQRIRTWNDDPQTRLEAFAITWERVDALRAALSAVAAVLSPLVDTPDPDPARLAQQVAERVARAEQATTAARQRVLAICDEMAGGPERGCSGYADEIRDALAADVPAAADEPCGSCNGDRWVDDENWQPEDYERAHGRRIGSGRIPCGICNHGGWNVPDGAVETADLTGGQTDMPDAPATDRCLNCGHAIYQITERGRKTWSHDYYGNLLNCPSPEPAPAAVVDQEETPHVYRSTCGLDCNGEETPC